MKHNIWTHYLISAMLAVALSVSAIGNLVTGYDLPVESVWKLYLWCALFSVASSVMFRFRYSGRIIVCLAALALFVLWKGETIWHQTQFLSFLISSHYHQVYAWPILGNPAANDVSLPLILWAALVAASVNWHICRRKHIVFALLPAVVPLALCLLTNDIVPDAVYLYLLILGFAVLLATDWTRRIYPAQGMKLVIRLCLPIAVSLALLFVLNPEAEYISNTGKLQRELTTWIEVLQDGAGSGGNHLSASTNERINLRTVGPERKISRAVMDVNAPVDGKLYLRGRDYDQYVGTGWEASSDRNEEFTSGNVYVGDLTIDTYRVLDVLYVPYYASWKTNMVGGASVNEERVQQYRYYLTQTGSGESRAPDSRYTRLPADTLYWAKELVEQITDGTPWEVEKINKIQDYVCNSAAYDLSTDRMDPQYGDFAQWFLEESDTGYCVHFATAATVLLRAAGIPARYVEGYMVSCSAREDVTVTNLDAHAWVEYFDWGSSSWRILDATPADSIGGGAEPTTTTPQTEPSTAEPSVPGDLPTKPHSNQEDLPEKPSDPTESTGTGDKKEESRETPEWIKTVFICLFLAACIPLQGYVRIRRKRSLWNRGRPNERTITRWSQTRYLAKLLKQPYPEDLENLAQKAKFSQHKILPKELQQFEDYRRSLMEQVQSHPWYHRIIFKWILAIG